MTTFIETKSNNLITKITMALSFDELKQIFFLQFSIKYRLLCL